MSRLVCSIRAIARAVRRAFRCEDAGVAMTTVVVLPVLLVLAYGTYDLGLLMQYRVQVRSAANAAVLTAIGKPSHWAIPIPRDLFLKVIPYNGWMTNLLWLKDVDGPIQHLSDEASDVIRWNENGTKLGYDVSMVPHTYLPSPVRYVKVTVTAEPPGLIGKVIYGKQKVSHSACGLAWIRPDYWWIPSWWDEKASNSRASAWWHNGTLPMKFYRMVECNTWKDGWKGVADSENWADLGRAVLELGELVITEHMKVTGDKSFNQEAARKDFRQLAENLPSVSSELDMKSAAKPPNDIGRPPAKGHACEGQMLPNDPWESQQESREHDFLNKAQQEVASCTKRKEEREAKEKAEKGEQSTDQGNPTTPSDTASAPTNPGLPEAP